MCTKLILSFCLALDATPGVLKKNHLPLALCPDTGGETFFTPMSAKSLSNISTTSLGSYTQSTIFVRGWNPDIFLTYNLIQNCKTLTNLLLGEKSRKNITPISCGLTLGILIQCVKSYLNIY